MLIKTERETEYSRGLTILTKGMPASAGHVAGVHDLMGYELIEEVDGPPNWGCKVWL